MQQENANSFGATPMETDSSPPVQQTPPGQPVSVNPATAPIVSSNGTSVAGQVVTTAVQNGSTAPSGPRSGLKQSDPSSALAPGTFSTGPTSLGAVNGTVEAETKIESSTPSTSAASTSSARASASQSTQGGTATASGAVSSALNTGDKMKRDSAASRPAVKLELSKSPPVPESRKASIHQQVQKDLEKKREEDSIAREKKRQEEEAEENLGAIDEDDSSNKPIASVLYTPGGQLPKIPSKYVRKMIEFRVPSKYITTNNSEVIRRHIWGTDIYTDDSDCVAILQHCGQVLLRSSPPDGCVGFSVVFRLLPGQDNYISSERNGIKSRQMTPTYHKYSLQLVDAERVQRSSHWSSRSTRSTGSKKKSQSSGFGSGDTKSNKSIKVLRMTNINETASASVAQKRTYNYIADTLIKFNRAMEPCLQYNVRLLSDRGLESSEFTSARLENEVFVFEGPKGDRYQLSQEIKQNDGYRRYQWSKVTVDPPMVPAVYKRQRVASTGSRAKGAGGDGLSAFSDAELSVIAQNLDWDELLWGRNALTVRGVEYSLDTVQFRTL